MNTLSIALVGMPGSGKSTVGRLLSQSLDFNYIDTDLWIENDQGISIPEIFTALGEPAFRQMEMELWSQIAHQPRTIFATGGGMAAAEYFWNFPVISVYLKTEVSQIKKRLESDTTRPLLTGGIDEQFSKLMAAREHFYQRATFQVDTHDVGPEEVTQRIIDLL